MLLISHWIRSARAAHAVAASRQRIAKRRVLLAPYAAEHAAFIDRLHDEIAGLPESRRKNHAESLFWLASRDEQRAREALANFEARVSPELYDSPIALGGSVPRSLAQEAQADTERSLRSTGSGVAYGEWLYIRDLVREAAQNFRKAAEVVARARRASEGEVRHQVGMAALQRPSARECCFFCSLPLPPDRRVRGAVILGGALYTVTACDAHAAPPERLSDARIRARVRDGRRVPWFAVPNYSPYRDYTPTYSVGVDPAALEGEDLRAALALADPSTAGAPAPPPAYSDDEWDPRYRDEYWDRHLQWERDEPWTQGAAAETALGATGAAPETGFGRASAAETAFSLGASAAETAFAASIGRSGGQRPEGGGAPFDEGTDLS